MTDVILRATPELCDEVSNLVFKLLRDLVGHRKEIDPRKIAVTSKKLLSDAKGFYAFLYRRRSESIGVITVSKSAAIYAGGYYGVIEELYVEPEFRSQSIGRTLLETVVGFAAVQGWSRLEVSTPEKEKWQRTIDFYLREGFSDNANGERLKREL
ncbi:GNAT family N-acetyltransferase [Microbulbifer sp. OS29]|uniref:GNAT family N-acetyltransferase n=1 Tax=Microbulbifer okhotskensis TaxID=2926617 RepID=A0A9X2J718_9GAMM|nr:GNAT family N-acetyltransferase [Microbulbifer okhotskensis]MCO1336778.1 GNAT family N-acetyltransferase [Microbulbifer okhotskensis]